MYKINYCLRIFDDIYYYKLVLMKTYKLNDE